MVRVHTSGSKTYGSGSCFSSKVRIFIRMSLSGLVAKERDIEHQWSWDKFEDAPFGEDVLGTSTTLSFGTNNSMTLYFEVV